MKLVFVFVVHSAIIGFCVAYSQPIIPNTKKTGTIGSRTGDYCGWDDVKIWPGETLNQIGKCRILLCSQYFEIIITPCPFDMTNRHKWINKDNSKEYPACCGEKVAV